MYRAETVMQSIRSRRHFGFIRFQTGRPADQKNQRIYQDIYDDRDRVGYQSPHLLDIHRLIPKRGFRFRNNKRGFRFRKNKFFRRIEHVYFEGIK